MCVGRLGGLILAALVGVGALGAAPAEASVSKRPLSTWQTNGRVNAILDLAGVTYLGGSFTRVSDHDGHSANVSNLAALDAHGDLVAGWTPRASSAVKALAADGANILAGGAFTKMDGTTRLHLALISPSGWLLSFKGHTNRQVDTVVVRDGTVYAGGLFTRASGSSRGYAAAFAATGGALRAWDPAADGRVDAIVTSGGGIVIGGMFNHVGARPCATPDGGRSGDRPCDALGGPPGGSGAGRGGQ